MVAVAATSGVLIVASAQCSRTDDHKIWHEEVRGQCYLHFTGAYLCFVGYVVYIIWQTFRIDPQLVKALPGIYVVPLWKKAHLVQSPHSTSAHETSPQKRPRNKLTHHPLQVLTVLPLVCLVCMMSGIFRPDLFEVRRSIV